MSRPRSSSASARSFKPTLEYLEERNLLSTSSFGDLGGVLSGLHDSIYAHQFRVGDCGSNLKQDVQGFNASKGDINAFLKLVNDCVTVIQDANIATVQLGLYGDAATFGGPLGLLNGPVPSNIVWNALGNSHSENPSDSPGLYLQDAADLQKNQESVQNNAALCEELIVRAFVAFLTGADLPTDIISDATELAPPPSPPSPPPATVTEAVNPAPQTASANGGPITESVTVNNPTGSTVYALVTYKNTDGSTASASDHCTNGSCTVPLQVNPSAAGSTGTWTVSVTGEPNQTNTTSFV